MMTQRVALIALLVAGCAGPPSVASIGDDIQVAALPDLPGCDAAQLAGAITLRPIAGVNDLYVVIVGGKAVCIDSGRGIGARTGVVASSLPGLDRHPSSTPAPPSSSTGNASSDPMPGDNTTPTPASSDPMPGDNSAPTPGNPIPSTSQNGKH
jgi:hypothetical protein